MIKTQSRRHAVSDSFDLDARRQERRQAMLRRLVKHLEDGTTDLHPSGPMSVDPTIYTDPARFELEKRELFLRRPVLAGLTQDVPRSGDMMTFDVLGPPILITRDKNGKVNAFRNMCTHRAGKLVTECTRRNMMTCRFHGWTFDLTGKLIGIPGADGFEGLDRAERGLVRVPAGEWNGMIFVKGEPGEEEIDVEAHLGSFAPVLAELELAKARPIKSTTIDAEANWKYVTDTYCEGYHFATLHANSIARLAVSNVMAYDAYGANHWLATCRSEFRDLVGKPEAEWPECHYGGLHFFFPNVIMNIAPVPGGGEFIGMSRVFPGPTVDTSRTLMTTYRPGNSNPDADDSLWAEIQDFVAAVVHDEDYSVAKDGQINLEFAPESFRPLIGANELAVQNVHRRIQEILDQAKA